MPPYQEIDGYLYTPPRTEFVHHEQCLCRLRAKIHTGGRVALYCSSHHRRRPSRAVAVRVCGDGRLILNVRSPGDCGVQAVKFDLGDGACVQVDRLPAILGRAAKAILAEPQDLIPDFVGYMKLGCSLCPDDNRPRLRPMFFAVNHEAQRVELLMHCTTCKAQTVVYFDAEDDVDVGECERHPLAA